MTKVKICGLKRLDDALAASEAGADLLGFVFAPSRRRIEPDTAADIIAAARLHSKALMVGVFVNEDPGEMHRVARICGLDYVQLSGHESENLVAALDLPTIQVVHVEKHMNPDDLARRVSSSRAELVLLDTAQADTYGGTGRAFEWRRVPAMDLPVLLAGGLHRDNVAQAIDIVRPWGVDVSSGVERDGEKDQTKIREFVAQVRACDATEQRNALKAL